MRVINNVQYLLDRAFWDEARRFWWWNIWRTSYERSSITIGHERWRVWDAVDWHEMLICYEMADYFSRGREWGVAVVTWWWSTWWLRSGWLEWCGCFCLGSPESVLRMEVSCSSRSRRACSLISLTARSSFLSFMRRFWNQILIWRSVRQRACAISIRLLRVK